MSRLSLDLAFLLGKLASTSILDFSLGFAVRDLKPASTLDLTLDFIVSPAPPTVYLYDRGDWQPVAQRTWTDGWFPPTV